MVLIWFKGSKVDLIIIGYCTLGMTRYQLLKNIKVYFLFPCVDYLLLMGGYDLELGKS